MEEYVSVYLAVDLGASSGRVMRANLEGDRLDLAELHRFANRPLRLPTGLHWDVLELYRQVVEGLRRAGREGRVAGVGVDSWGVDYALLSESGQLLGVPRHYRDARAETVGEVGRLIPDAELYARAGIAPISINTLYRLFAARKHAETTAASSLLMIPDLFTYWLCGAIGTEYTNATTTGLVAQGTRFWDTDLLDRLGLPVQMFTPVIEPGTLCGQTLPHVTRALGTHEPVPVYRVASHDTASAIAAIPAQDDAFAYISCGTWSLVGLELAHPVISAEALAAGFSNEGGVDGRTCFHRNNMGLWLLQECLREWAATGPEPDLVELLAVAERAPASQAVIDTGEYRFLPPGDMPARLAAFCAETGQPIPADRGGLVRCLLESLALAYRDTIDTAERLTGRRADRVHLVGGGSRNGLLCQLTADACRRPVVAGPVEATALGNVLVQARGTGEVSSLVEIREIVRQSGGVRRYEPRDTGGHWERAAAMLLDLRVKEGTHAARG